MKKRSPFTLIELLAVIAIIALLAGLLLPAVQSSRGKAYEAKARGQIKNLQIAIDQYMQEYSVVPVTTDTEFTTGSNSDLIDYLQGNNPRGIQFLDVQNNTADQYIDPWGNPYNVALDTDYDGKIEDTGPNDSTTVHANSAIWTETLPDGSTVLKSWE